MTEPLSDTVIGELLRTLSGWEYKENKLSKDFEFDDFTEALSFIVKVGVHAEKLNHHPHITNIYNKVQITLSTHDANDQVTDKDVKLAQAIESVL